MKNFTNQRGLAMLEVVIVAAIVAIFSTVAVPKMARILDKVQLDYEMKHLYSTLNLTRSIGKNSSLKPVIFSGIKTQSEQVELQIHKNKNDAFATNRYEIVRQDTGAVYHMHYLRGGVKLNFAGGSPMKIHFDDANKYSDANGTITLTSQFGEAYVISNSVGRFRGSYEKPKS